MNKFSFDSDVNSVESQGITFTVKHRFEPFRVARIILWNSVFIIFIVFASLNFVRKSKKTIKGQKFSIKPFFFQMILVNLTVNSNFVRPSACSLLSLSLFTLDCFTMLLRNISEIF